MGNLSCYFEKIRNFFPCCRRRFQNQVEPPETTSLHEAVKMGDEKKVLKLVKKKKVNVNVINKDGFTPIHFAVKYGHPNLIRILMEKGGDMNIAGFHGLRPFHMLMISRNKDECLEEILKYKPDIDAREILGNTILQIMVMISPTNIDVILKLLEHGSNPNNLNVVGNNCLHNIAMLEKNVGNYRTKILARALLQKGLDPNCRNNAGNTPLHFAARGNPALVSMLIEFGADINLENYLNLTPFDVATVQNDKDVIQQFIKNIVLRKHRGFPVNESILKKTRSSEFYRNITSRFENEMVVLEKMKLHDKTTISFYDVLCNRRKRRRVIKDISLYRHMNSNKLKYFSYYSDVWNIVSAEIKKIDHEEFAYQIVESVLGDKLPHLCIEKIASYLQPKDVKGLERLIFL